MILLSLLSLALAAQEPTTRSETGRAWITCTFGFAQRTAGERASVESIADAALSKCSREEGAYWTDMYQMYLRHMNSETARGKADQYMATQRASARTDIMAMVLEYRATLRGK